MRRQTRTPRQEPGESRFRALVLPHLDAAFRCARALAGNATDAEDIVQEACLRAINGLETQTGGTAKARSWLIAIVRNTAFTWLARNRGKTLVLTGDVEALAEDRSRPAPALPDADLIARADAAALTRALDALPGPLRETLVLREIGELSYREIAETLDVPIGTVMSRLARARERMIELLAEDFP